MFVGRYWSEDGVEKEKESATVIPTINTAGTTTHTTAGDGRERRRYAQKETLLLCC